MAEAQRRPLGAVVQQSGPLPPLVAAELLRQLLEQLDALHASGGAHGDVSLSSLYLVASADDRPHLDLSSPEVPDEGASPAADVHAVGQAGLEMLTRAGTVSRPHGIPKDLWSLLADLTATEPSARPTAREALDRLRGPGLAWPTSGPAVEGAGPTPAVRVVVVVVVAIIVAATIAAFWVMWGIAS